METQQQVRHGPDYLYRQGIGVVLINRKKEILVGKRKNNHSYTWQMPQGGMELGETEEEAAVRELTEEMSIVKVTILAKSAEYYYYNFPYKLQKKFWLGKYLGQRQRWFLMQHLGEDNDANVATPEAEFSQFKWMPPSDVVRYVVPFKRMMYQGILAEFAELL